MQFHLREFGTEEDETEVSIAWDGRVFGTLREEMDRTVVGTSSLNEVAVPSTETSCEGETLF